MDSVSGGEFRATGTADKAASLTDGVRLYCPNDTPVILPWIGFGTYKLGKEVAYQCVLDALETGYRCIDTAFIYGGEKTERLVGQAIQAAFHKQILNSRQDVFVVTKHWRKYHGYDQTLECLNLSLKRLQLEYVDLYLMHWPGPAWKTMHRETKVLQAEGPWYYAADNCKTPEQMIHLRAQTWRAMEDALRQGKVRAIGVSNFTIEHLKNLKRTATIWPPAVNQVECHPLYPQSELLEYCRQEGIVVQAYASLGGQDTGKIQWKKLALEGDPSYEEDAIASLASGDSTGKKQRKSKQKKLRDTVVALLSCRPVISLSRELKATPAQILLQWALSQNCAVIPKASSKQRMRENAESISFPLMRAQVSDITEQVQAALLRAAEAENEVSDREDASSMGRLCWRKDPLRLLDFE